MDRLRAPPLVVFAALSLAIHALGYGVVRRGAHGRAATFDPSSQTLAGESLDVEPAPARETDEPTAKASSAAGADREPSIGPGFVAAIPAPPARRPSTSAAESSRRPPFGAVGVRFATDLATTLTRAFSQAASADPIWSRVRFGSAGRAQVVLVLDDQGHLVDSSIGGAPSPALRRGIERTLVLLAPRVFTARDPVTRLTLAARVSPDDVHDGLHGDVFALSGGSFSGEVGAAFFALPPHDGQPGRRVDLEVRAF